MKHIIQFSGGIASAYVAFLCIEEFGKNNCILLNHDTKVEHGDTGKFKNDVCNYLGVDMIELSDGRDLWDLIVVQKSLPSNFIPFCTRILKQEQGFKFLKTFKDKFVIYNGFGTHEERRVLGSRRIAEKKGYTVHSPLFEQNITDKMAMEIIRDEWKIQIPEPYMNGFEHNNCLPCFKGGKAHFKRVWQFYPGSFEKAKWAEEKIGHTVFKLKRKTEIIKQSLLELEKRWAEEPVIKPRMASFKHADLWQLDMFEGVTV